MPPKVTTPGPGGDGKDTLRGQGALARAVGTRPGGQGALRTGKDGRILDTQLQWAGVPRSSPPSGQAAGPRGFPWPFLRAWGAALKPRYGVGGTYPEVGSQPGNGVCGRELLWGGCRELGSGPT